MQNLESKYNHFIDAGIKSLPKSYAEFEAAMKDKSGGAQQIYNGMKNEGVELPEFDEFYSVMMADETNAQPVKSQSATPSKPAVQAQPAVKGKAQTATPMTEDEQKTLIAKAETLKPVIDNIIDNPLQRVDNLSKINQPFKKEVNLGTQVNKVGDKYITTAGNDYNTPEQAKLEQFMIDESNRQRKREVDTVRARELDDEINKERENLKKIKSTAIKTSGGFMESAGSYLPYDPAAASESEKKIRDLEQERRKVMMPMISEQLIDVNSRIETLNEEINALKGGNADKYSFGPNATTRVDDKVKLKNKELSLAMEERDALELMVNGEDKNFFSGLIYGMTRPSTYTFGLYDLAMSQDMLKAKNAYDKGALTDDQKQFMAAYERANTAKSELDSNADSTFRFGNIAAQSAPFMLEFFGTGGMGSIRTYANALARLTAQKFAKDMAKGMAKNLTRGLIKKTGIFLGDVAAAGTMAVTAGGARTASDIINRYTGHPVQKDNEFTFKDGTTLADAVYKGLTSSTIEYYTEMLGTHMESVFPWIKSVVGKRMSQFAENVKGTKMGLAMAYGSIGLKKLGEIADKTGIKSIYNDSKKAMQLFGLQSYPYEALEEEAGIVLNSMLTGDNNISDLIDERTQEDIWGGMLYSIGMMQGVTGGYSAIKYYGLKHKLSNQDIACSNLFGDQWASIKEQIDNATNVNLLKAIFNVRTKSDEERKALLVYGGVLSQFRGFNTAIFGETEDKADNNTPGNPVTDAVNRGFTDGYNSADEETARIEKDLNDKKDLLNYDPGMSESEQFQSDVVRLQDSQEDALDYLIERYGEQHISLATDYYNALNIYNGLTQRKADEDDDRLTHLNQQAERNEYKGQEGQNGNVIMADMGGNKVYIVRGDVNTDTGEMSGAIVVRDEQGKIIVTNGNALTLESVRPLEEIKQENAEIVAAERLAKEQEMKLAEEQQQQEEQQIDQQQQPQDQPKDNQEQPQDNQIQQPQDNQEQQQEPAIDEMPMIGEGEDAEPDFYSVSPSRSRAFIYDESDLSEEEATDFVNANIDVANREVNALEKKKPKASTSIKKYKKELEAWKQELEQAKKKADYWQQVKTEQSNIITAKQEEIRLRDEAENKKAVEEELQRQQEIINKRKEQERIGANAVHPDIRKKWDSAPKIDGAEDEITLANGEKIKGRYVLVESGAATPSHNPTNGFSKNEGFPVDENGQTVNDRDYKRDKDAQDITRQTASSYDSRALQDVPVVSSDGIVLSGNGRTMAGELAARDNTDGNYIEHLQKYPEKFGFTKEQVSSMKHPRVLFVTSNEMPYNADTFSKFNAQDKKSQSRTEQSIKLGKTVDDSTFEKIVQHINSFDSIADFYGNDKATAEAISELQKAGVINAMQYAEMFDGENVSGIGRQMLENMLVGKFFQKNPEAIRQLSEIRSLRQNVISALAEISNNRKLGNYSLESELAQAIDLAYQARKHGFKHGDKVSGYARQMNLFPFEMGETVADYTNATILMLANILNDKRTNKLKNTLTLYNRSASDSAIGQMDLFTGSVRTKEEIIKDILKLLDNGTKEEQESAINDAVERRKADSNEQDDAVRKSVEKNDKTSNPLGRTRNRNLSKWFGPIYTQFEGKANEAESHLRATAEGVAKGALVYPGVSPIDLVWGDMKAGYMKIVIKHPEVVGRLQEILSATTITSQSDNRIVFESDTHKMIVSRMKGSQPTDNWLLTAYEKKEKPVSASSSDIETEPEGKRNGTATPQNGASSADKVTNTPNNNQDETEKKDESKSGVKESRVVGGNSGYVGYSMSKRAAQAREEGRFPKTDFKKVYGLNDRAFDMLVSAGIIDDSEWHHTSKFGNKTTFYSWAEDVYAEIYAANKKEIDAIAKKYNLKNQFESPEVSYGKLPHEYRIEYRKLDNDRWKERNALREEYKGVEDGPRREEYLEKDRQITEKYDSMEKEIQKKYPEYAAYKENEDNWRNRADEISRDRKKMIEEVRSLMNEKERDMALRDAVIELLQQSGIEVVTNEEEAQRVLDDAQRMLDNGDIREHKLNLSYYPRLAISPVRGKWTKSKIIKRLKDIVGTKKGYSFAARRIAEFDSAEELAEHMFYHGTQFGSGRLKPSILMSDSEVERIGGGGYGQKYWGISVSKSKRIASNFSTGRIVRVYPIILVKNAKIKEMPELSDAADLEDYIEDLWEEGVDAVWIGDKNRGEQELCVINPAAIVNIDNPDIYEYYKLGTSENPLNIIDNEGINKLYQDAKRYVNALENKPKKPEKPSRFLPAKDGETIGEMKSDEQYQKEMSEYERKLDEYNNSDEVRRFQQEDEYAYRNIRFFKTPSGHAYGFTVDGKIYVDKKIAGSETPIHEYSHLWAAAIRQVNQEEWKNIVSLMKGTTLWDEVKKNYPELTTDDDIADEVLAHYSGKRGAERLNKAQEEAMKQDGLFDKAATLSAIYRVKEALNRFWKGVADFIGVHFTSAEEVADKVLSDLLNGVNPANVAKNGKLRMMGSRVDGRMVDIGLHFEGRELGVNERAVVDVYSGKAKNDSVTVTRDGKEHKIVMRQGTEDRAGTKHSLLRHYGTGVGTITVEDLLIIPDVIERGEMEQNGKKRVYRMSKDGVRYTVLCEVNNGREDFSDFYSNRKGGDTSSSNTQLSARDYDATTNSAAKVVESFESPMVLGEEKSNVEGNLPKVKDGLTLYVAKDGSKIVSRSLFRDEDFKQIEAASEDASKGRAVRRKTVFSPARIRLRKLKEGETCSVERRYVENGMFDFTGKEKIESDADVAYIFRQLENAAVENCFMVLLKDGRPTVIHLSMGSYSSTMAPFEQAFVAYSALKPDNVYFVHNHPSGNLKASRQDMDMLDRMKKMFGSDVVNPGIIIDTTSGKYGVFDGINIEEDMPVRQEGEVPLKVYNFSKQVFSPGWNPMESFKIKIPDDVAAFVSSHRLGKHEKMSFLVLGNDNSVVANVFLPYTKLSDIEDQGELKSATDMMAGYVHQCGGTRGIIYGNYYYTSTDGKLLSKISLRMKELGAPLLDAIHIEHSAMDEGVIGETGVDGFSLETVNKRFNNELERYKNREMASSEMLHLGNPRGVMRKFLPNIPIVMRQRILNKGGVKKHNVDVSSLSDMPQYLSNPIFVFQRNDNTLGVLTEMKDRDGKNVCVAIEINRQIQDGGDILEVNDIRSVHGRNIADIIYPIINNETLKWVDKEKGLSYLSSASRYVQQEIDKKDLISATKVVKEFKNPIIEEDKNDLKDEILTRAGSEKDTISEKELVKSPQKPIYTEAQKEGFAKREKRRVSDAAREMAARLGIEDDVEFIETNEGLTGREATAKGWFNRKTGKIVVVLGNHISQTDVLRTIIHEGVAHYGLRKLLGERFDTFLDEVFKNAEQEVKESILELSKKHGYNIRTATEEYLASLAEKMDFEKAKNSGWWTKIKSMFLDMMRQLGLGTYAGPALTDNELRYLLWRSYENLAEPGRMQNPFAEAKDTSKQLELKVGGYENRSGRVNATSEKEGDLLFRDGDFTERDEAIARDAYENAMRSGRVQFIEEVQDSMRSLVELYKAILGKKTRVEDIEGFENPYMFENRLSSMNMAQQHLYFINFMKPILKAINRICKGNEKKREELINYMMAKHGLERNLVFARRDAKQKAREEFAKELRAAEKAVNDDPLDMDAVAAFEDVKKRMQELEEKLFFENREKDYGGITGLIGIENLKDAEEAARTLVDDYEGEHDFYVTDLWNAVNAATQATLEKIYESGSISKESYENIRDMFEYYIPLQGWDETTSDEVYAYLIDRKQMAGAPIKHAKGRRSKADDPIATIGMRGEMAVMQANRNLMKQTFLNFVLDHPSDLVSVSDLWLEHDDVNDVWNPVFVDIEEGDTAEDIQRKTEAFEQQMLQLQKSDPKKYKKSSQAQNIPYKVVPGNLKPHQVIVKRNGKSYVLTINGNPKAAMALNGLTNPDVEQKGFNKIMNAATYVNRKLSIAYTTANINFTVSNFVRDMVYSNTMAWIKESPWYALNFHWNCGKYNPAMMRRLFGKWENGTLNLNNKTEKLFYDFMKNGGETGFSNVRDIDAQKKFIISELKKENSLSRKAIALLISQLDMLNRSVENTARFAAFVTSRGVGRSIERSVYDAKEVSVNFNKKGSGGRFLGEKGQTALGNVGSVIGGSGRIGYVFWNAGIQGLSNIGKNIGRHKIKGIAGLAAMYVLGRVIPMLYGDDDDNSYYDIPEKVRRSNICIKVGEQWVTIPLPIEFRAIYGLGELATGVESNNDIYTDNELAYQIGSQISQILPIDFLEGDGGVKNFVPTLLRPSFEAYFNESWTGLPIYKDTPWNQNMPGWTKAYKNANVQLVDFAKFVSDITGGDEYKKGTIDINPAQVEHILNGMFGGYVVIGNQLVKMAETAMGERDFDWRNMIIANRVITNGDERVKEKRTTGMYYKIKEEVEENRRLINSYRKDEMDEKADKLETPEYENALEDLKESQKNIKDIKEMIDETSDKDIQKELNKLIRQEEKTFVERHKNIIK